MKFRFCLGMKMSNVSGFRAMCKVYRALTSLAQTTTTTQPRATTHDTTQMHHTLAHTPHAINFNDFVRVPAERTGTTIKRRLCIRFR